MYLYIFMRKTVGSKIVSHKMYRYLIEFLISVDALCNNSLNIGVTCILSQLDRAML